MKTFEYRSKGSADDWTTDTIEAEDKDDAQKKLDVVYGVTRDKTGNQTNTESVQIELMGEKK